MGCDTTAMTLHGADRDGSNRSNGSLARSAPTAKRQPQSALYRLYLGVADGMLRGGHLEYRHAHTRAMGMPSAMPRWSR